MTYAKIQPQGILNSGEEDFKVFTIYGHGGHLGQWTATILAIFRSPKLRRLHMKFEQYWLRASDKKLFENVDRLTDGRKVITIAHPEHSSGELKRDPQATIRSFE